MEMMYDGFCKYGQKEAQEYDAAREKEPLWDAENRFVEKYFSGMELARLLDAPVGTGRFLPYYHRAKEVFGLDISESMLFEAKARTEQLGLQNVHLAPGDIFALDFPDRYFDAVVSWRFLHLLPQELLVPALTELGRVAAGAVLVQVYIAPGLRGVVPSVLRRIGRVAFHLFHRREPDDEKKAWSHIQAYNHSWRKLKTAFEAAGLRIVARERLARYGDGEVAAVALRAK